MAKQHQHRYTDEQLDWLRAHAPGRPWLEVSDLFNHHFGLGIKWPSVWAVCKRRGISNGRCGRFVAGQDPWNRAVPNSTGYSPTRFQPGSKPHNHVPVGTERNNDGYIEVKTAEPHVWRSKAQLVWEAHHGRPVPPGHAVLFADQDRANFCPDNLLLVSRAELAVMNKRRLIVPGLAEGARAGQLVARIVMARRKRQRPQAQSATAQQL